jgi:glyoxylase-like metal-dependent hydrolase (beta-lactamase superfamily II)
MNAARWLVILGVAACGACAAPAPEQQIVDDAAAALGGRDRLLAVKTLTLEGDGTNGNLGQDVTPEASDQRFVVPGYRRSVDVPGRRVRVEQTRTPNFVYYQGQAAQKQVFGIVGDVAYRIGADGRAARLPDAVARDRRTAFFHHPLTIVRAAMDSGTALANPRSENGQRIVDLTTADGLVLTLAIDGTTKLPVRVVSMAGDPNMGDVAIETSFADYQNVDGLMLPMRITERTDRYVTSDLRLAKQVVDGDAADLAAPAAAAAAEPIDAPPPPKVTTEEVGKGIWLLAGESHHSVLVEFADHLMLIEAPMGDARAFAVMARARELRPGKPLTQLVVTHHHFDHSGGMRAAVSEGLTVITQASNAPFCEEMVRRPHTIAPDALASHPRPLTLEKVDDERVIADEAMTVQLLHMIGNPHADALLMAYFPKQRILVEADAYNPADSYPGAEHQPYAANLLENVRNRRLNVDRIVPIHGKVVPFGELVKTVGQ